MPNTEIKLDLRYMRPQFLEKLPLSGKKVSFRSHSGTGLSWRGRQFTPGEDGIVRDVPIEAIQQISDATYWPKDGKPFQVKFDIIPEEPETETV